MVYFAITVLNVLAQADAQMPAKYLAEMHRVLPRSEAWDAWLESSDELPPDFSAMPSIHGLPDPLKDGPAGEIKSAAAWAHQRAALLDIFHQWFIGSVPPAPDNLIATVLSERREHGAAVREVELRFGPELKAKLWLELMIPDGHGPFPVFLTQDNHRGWGLIALRRGYAVCVYAGADSRDDTATFIDAYPDYDWSKLTRRAWAASRCIDYLETVDAIDAEKIALTGHSRNGKLSVIASALDERIACVIASSSGAGGVLATRDFGEHHFGEGIENITRQFPDWFHPRLRFFAGREDKLPADFHQLVALSAPRPCLLSIALNDNVESTWAMERTYRAVKSVYALFGAEDNLAILYRPGGHETTPTTIERYLDWCDTHFGRGEYDFPEQTIHPHDLDPWTNWRVRQKFFFEPIDLATITAEAWHNHRPKLAEAVSAILGVAPPAADGGEQSYGVDPEHAKVLLRRGEPAGGLERESVVFGDYINADVYMPEGYKTDGKRHPAVLWLPAACPSTGYVPAYRRGEYPHVTFARAGYVTFAYDPIGYGGRIEEVRGFYDRYPRWTLLGAMVRDAQAALTRLEALPYVDAEKIYVVGYHLGALVALHLAAFDDRPAGYALAAPPASFASAESGVQFADAFDPMLLPVLQNRSWRRQYDVADLIAMIAPKPALIVTPELDRLNPIAQATAQVDAARHIFELYGRGDLTQSDPHTYNHFDNSMQREVTRWLATQQ